MMQKTLLLTLIVLLWGCSSTPRKMVLDTSSPERPDWVDDSRISWSEDKRIHFKGDYTVRGNERADACIDLAKLNVKEALITEIQEELKGAVDNASDSIREDAEIILSKSRSAEYSGSISGLRFVGRYWEKYALVTEEQKNILSRSRKYWRSRLQENQEECGQQNHPCQSQTQRSGQKETDQLF